MKMIDNTLKSVSNYSRFVAELVHRPTVERSTLVVWPESRYSDPNLASTFPHHKHVLPDIKHNRIPAAEMSFTRPNLPALIREIEKLAKF